MRFLIERVLARLANFKFFNSFTSIKFDKASIGSKLINSPFSIKIGPSAVKASVLAAKYLSQILCTLIEAVANPFKFLD